MTKHELHTRKAKYLSQRKAIDNSLEQIKESLTNLQKQMQEAIEERDTMQTKLTRIKDLAESLGTLPSLTKLRDFLKTIKELIQS